MTAQQKHAIRLLCRRGAMSPKEFARAMWPKSPGWKRPRKCGAYGVHRGMGMVVSAGCFLGKLHKRGLTKIVTRLGVFPRKHAISDKGRKLIGEEYVTAKLKEAVHAVMS